MLESPALNRYISIITLMIANPNDFQPTVENPSQIQVERGLHGPIFDLPADRQITVVDAGGHARPVYRPLLVYSWLLNCNPQRSAIEPWINSLDTSIWSDLVRGVAGEMFDQKTWTESSGRSFDRLIDHQQTNGLFLPPDSSANPETRWYEELMLLHAVASYATRTNDHRFDRAVERSANYHLEETQPDHASAQPWALLAFVQYAPPLADQVLHALSMQYPGAVSGVPLLLLTDALYGLQRLIDKANKPTLTTDRRP